MAPKTSKTATAWWLVSNSKNMPLFLKCQTNNQFKPDNPKHKPGSPWENWSLPTTSQLHLSCTAWSLPGKLRQSCDSYAAAFCCRCGPKRDRWQTHGRTLLARWQYNFNSGSLASGKTRMARNTSKFTTAWWLASKGKNMPVAMKCQINNQLKPDLPQDKPGSPSENCSLLTTSQLPLFCTTFTQSLLRTILAPASCWLSQSCYSCEAAHAVDVGPNGTDDKHSLEEHLWHVASTTSTVAPLRVARLGWLPRRAKLPLHDGWHRNRKICRCLSNVQPTISSSQIFPNTNLDRLGKTGCYLQLRSFTFFALHDLYSGPF